VEAIDLIILAPLFDGCLYKVKNDQLRTESIIGDLFEVSTQRVDGFCKMDVDVGSGESWIEAA
jgi:hypothetical protein